MRKTLIAAACVLLTAAASEAQTPVTPQSTDADRSSTAIGPREEGNIRAYIELLRKDLKNSKSKIMGELMQLDTSEATKFWPIYKEFEAEYTALGDQMLAVVRKYTEHQESMTNAVAEELGNQILTIERQRNGLKKKHYDRLKNEVGAITATRFLQVENQLERIVDLQIAAQLPIIGQQ